MSRYIRRNYCSACGQPHWFRYWVGEFCAKSTDGLSVGDFDMPFHRFKGAVCDNLGRRDVEHFMVVEVKTENEQLGGCQRDSLSVFNALLNAMIPVNGDPIKVKSRPGFLRKGDKKVVWHGAHLLRVPARYTAIGPFRWDNKPIDSNTLRMVLNFDRDPNAPALKLDVDRRHKKQFTLKFIGGIFQ